MQISAHGSRILYLAFWQRCSTIQWVGTTRHWVWRRILLACYIALVLAAKAHPRWLVNGLVEVATKLCHLRTCPPPLLIVLAANLFDFSSTCLLYIAISLAPSAPFKVTWRSAQMGVVENQFSAVQRLTGLTLPFTFAWPRTPRECRRARSTRLRYSSHLILCSAWQSAYLECMQAFFFHPFEIPGFSLPLPLPLVAGQL